MALKRPMSESYQIAISDKEFIDDMISYNPKNKPKHWFIRCTLDEHIYVSIYLGWLIAKGRIQDAKNL